MTDPRTKEQCKSMLFKLAVKHGVAPRLIYDRLLSKEDKDDMLSGLVTFDSLDKAVEVWMESGMGNYAQGSNERYSELTDRVAITAGVDKERG